MHAAHKHSGMHVDGTLLQLLSVSFGSCKGTGTIPSMPDGLTKGQRIKGECSQFITYVTDAYVYIFTTLPPLNQNSRVPDA
jgi:hypothetical protein